LDCVTSAFVRTLNPYCGIEKTEKVPTMRTRFFAPSVALAVLLFSPLARSQNAAPESGRRPDESRPAFPLEKRVDGWGRPVKPPVKGQKSDPAPKHDISGIWDPGDGGIQALGPAAMPEDGKPEHRLPYTPLGLETLNATKPSNGARSALPNETNDPVVAGDPQGMPREDLFELRTTQILQTPVQVYLLYEFGRVWRVIWTDGREVPKDPEPRWFGYSVGKWVDDYTLVVQTSGTDERTWIDHAGRPHSGDMRVEERFHRVDHDHLELTVAIDDPKMYTKPWVALDKLVFNLEPQTFDVREMIWAPTEFQGYNKLLGNSASDQDRQ
jgi:hypothetical protein